MILDFSKNINIKSLFPENEFEEKVISFLQNWFYDSETVSVQTSGSTGIPKVFEIEKSRMLQSAKMTCDFLGLKEGDSALLCLPAVSYTHLDVYKRQFVCLHRFISISIHCSFSTFQGFGAHCILYICDRVSRYIS